MLIFFLPEHVEFNLFFSSVQVLWQEQGAQRSLLEEKIQHSYDEIDKLAINHSFKDQSELEFSASPEIKDIIPAFYRQIELNSLTHPVAVLKEQLSSYFQKERKPSWPRTSWLRKHLRTRPSPHRLFQQRRRIDPLLGCRRIGLCLLARPHAHAQLANFPKNHTDCRCHGPCSLAEACPLRAPLLRARHGS